MQPAATVSSPRKSPEVPSRSPSPPNPTMTVVIKVGTSTLMNEATQDVALSNVASLIEVVCNLRRQGHGVVLVSSGAVGIGCRRLGMTQRPSTLTGKQAVAAVGQGRLMRMYDDMFTTMNQPIAQVLLTRNDIHERHKFENARNTFKELLNMGVVPIVNENDTVAVEELRFGDNDTLSALVADIVDADWLFLLTDVPCLYTANPKTNPDATPIHLVEDISHLNVDVKGGSAWGTGGMVTKLTAARIATAAGVNTGITLGSEPLNVLKMLAGESLGTIFKGKQSTKVLKTNRRWILSLPTVGRLWIDDGAVNAVAHNKSLFAVGIKKCEGSFASQEAVSILNSQDEEIARGLVNYTDQEVTQILGKHSNEIAQTLGYHGSEEVIYRSNIVMI